MPIWLTATFPDVLNAISDSMDSSYYYLNINILRVIKLQG